MISSTPNSDKCGSGPYKVKEYNARPSEAKNFKKKPTSLR